MHCAVLSVLGALAWLDNRVEADALSRTDREEGTLLVLVLVLELLPLLLGLLYGIPLLMLLLIDVEVTRLLAAQKGQT